MLDALADVARPIRVLIVDDHAMFAESVARLFERESDMTVVGLAATSAIAIGVAADTRPDVAVVDYGLPDADGARTAAGIRSVSPATSVVVLTGLPDAGIATAAIQAGCAGFLTKDKAARELVAIVRVVHAGGAHIPPNQLAALQRGLALEKMKGEFVARIGHEFRTPLTAILGYGHVLAHRETHAHRRELGAQIVAAGEKLKRIVEILEFTASSACGTLTVSASVLDPDALLDDAVNRWISRLGRAHELKRDASRSPVGVMADPRWLGMAIDELIDNAVKFSPAGGSVTVAASEHDLAGVPAVEIAVIDQGIGMSSADRDLAFDEYMQVDASDTRSFGGLGLGLSLVRGVAVAHGGAVSCAAVDPVGTRVAVTIPAAL